MNIASRGTLNSGMKEGASRDQVRGQAALVSFAGEEIGERKNRRYTAGTETGELYACIMMDVSSARGNPPGR